jgi:hypothetical protein
MKEIFVEREQVAAIVAGTYPDYRGNKIRVIPAETVTFQNLNWQGGTRSQYRACDLSGGPLGSLDKWNQVHPRDNAAESSEIRLPEGAAIVEHSLDRGKDTGLRIYIRPADMPNLLPAPVALSSIERAVLVATRSYKSSYGGRDRYQMARDDAPGKIADFPSRAQWDAAKIALAERGLLTKAGGITNAGRNAIA